VANLPALVLDLSIGGQRQITGSDNLYVGAGIDRASAGTLTVGGTTATALTLSSSGATTTVAGPLSQTTGQVTLNGNVDATAGLDVTTAALTAAAALTVSGGALTMTGSNINLDPTGTFDLAMDAAQTIAVHMADNLTDALQISDTGGNYINLDTNTGSEAIELGNATDNPTLSQLGTGQVSFAGNVDAANGLDVTTAALTAAAALTVTGGAFTFSGSNIDLDPTGTFDLAMDAAQTATITLGDNLTDAFQIKDASGNYINLDTNTGSEVIELGNATDNVAITQLGTGQVSFAGNVDAANGLDVTTAALTAAAGLTVSGGAVSVTGSNIDLDPTGTFALDMDAAQTATVTLADNLASALLVKDGSVNYIDVDTATGAEKIDFGNATDNPDYNFLGTGQADFDGDVVVSGNFHVQGTTTTVSSENVNYSDNHLYLNDGYETTSTETGGVVVNYLPTATNDTVNTGGFTAGVASTSDATVITSGSGTFTAGDFIQIAGAADQGNDGLFEVHTHVGTTLVIAGVGAGGADERVAPNDFTQTNFTTDATVQGTIRKVTLGIMRCGTDGIWETAAGSTTTGLSFADLASAAGTSLGGAYDVGRAITGDDGPITYAFSTTAGGVLDIDVAGGASVLADTAAIIDVTYAANAYTGGAAVLKGDWSGMTSLTKATDVPMISLVGKTNAGAGDSIGLNIDSGFDQGIENASSYVQTGGALTFSGTNLDLDPTGTFALDMDAASTATITLGDNLSDAFQIKDAGGNYINLDTNTGSEVIELGNATDNVAITQLGTGQVTFAGNVDATGGVDINADNANLTIGAGADLTVVHNATNTIATSTTGDFIIDNTNATGSTIVRLGTDTTATDFQVQNNSESALFGFLGAGDLQVGGSSGTSGQFLTSGGAGAAPTWTTGSGGTESGTTNLTYTINDDGTAGSNEDPCLILEGGDGGSELINSFLCQDSSADTLYLYTQLSTVADTGSDRSTDLTIGPSGDFNATGNDADAILRFRGHQATDAVGVATTASIQMDASADDLIITGPSGGAISAATNFDAEAGLDVSGGALTITNQAITQTTGGQVDFAGNVDATGGIDIDADNANLTIGAGADLTVVHDGSNTTITSITGNLTIDNTAGGSDTIFVLGTNDTTSEFQVQNNGNTTYLSVRGDGLVNVSDGTLDVPAGTSFLINGTALTTANFTAANMDTLLDGSNADTLHTHAGVDADQIVSQNWDTNTNSVAAGDVAAYTTTADRADQADATAASGAQTCIGISSLQHASAGTIVRSGRYATARFAASLSLANGARCFVSKTAGALTDDVSGYGTGDKVIPVGYIRDTLSYNGTDNFLVDIELDFGEITTIA
jgi:filamentous hemagglutinin